MYIRRDYTQPFFSNRRRKRRWWLWITLYALLIGGFLFFIDSQFSRLQLMALQVVGQAPEPTPFASDYANQSMDRYLTGNLRDAADLMAQAVRQQPQNVDYLYEYGRILLEIDNENQNYYALAIQIGDQAIQANPNDPRGYALKARALDLNDDAPTAITVAQQGLNVDRNFAPLYAALSSAYLTIDRYDVSIENAERAIELDPFDPMPRRIYAYSLMWLGRYDEATSQLQEAVSLNPNLAGPYFELASLYRRQAGQIEDSVMAVELRAQSIALYEEVLSLQPENARAYLRLCDSYFEARENARATDYCLEAVNIDPNYAAAWASLGQTQFSRRNFEGAMESFDRCVEIAGDNADIRCYYLDGLSHYYMGECDEAWNELSDSLRRHNLTNPSPDDAVLVNILSGLRFTTLECAAYQGRALPTNVPPTPIPPTPIGG